MQHLQSPLVMKSPYDVLCDALITTYTGERYGIRPRLALRQRHPMLPHMRPYLAERARPTHSMMSLYAITHVIYTLNDYSAWRLRPEWLPDEFRFLRSNLKQLLG